MEDIGEYDRPESTDAEPSEAEETGDPTGLATSGDKGDPAVALEDPGTGVESSARDCNCACACRRAI